jgi:hypothetical protein
MADWHPEFRQFVPKGVVLGYPQALGVQNALHIFIASLEQGRPATRSEKARRRLAEKYPWARSLFIFDRPLQDLYTLLLGPEGLTLVTVTAMEDERAVQVLDDLKPPARFADVDEIRLPYVLACPLQGDPEFLSIRTPAGRELRVSYDFSFRPVTAPPAPGGPGNYRVPITR